MSRVAAAAALLLALVALTTTAAAAPPTLSDIEDEVMCVTCGTALALSQSPVARRERALIQRLIDKGRSKEQIKARLVDEFGPQVLATPARSGFSLAAYLVPLAGLLLALAGTAVALARRRHRPADDAPERPAASFEDLVDADLAGRRAESAR